MLISTALAQRVRGRPDWILGPAAIALAVCIGYLAVGSPVVTISVVGAAAVAIVAWLRPEITLAVALPLSLAGGDFATGAAVGQRILVLAGVVSLLRLTRRGQATWFGPALFPLMLLGWLAIRLVVDEGPDAARPVLVAALAFIIVRDMVTAGNNVRLSLAWSGLTFVVASFLIGQMDPTGLRFEGISGNPNRMVFGLLVFLPTLLGSIRRGGNRVANLLFITGVALSVDLIMRSGSSQGLVGMSVLAFAILLFATRRWPGELVFIAAFIATTVLAWYLSLQFNPAGVSADMATLSGRSETFAAGWDEVLRSPILGTGAVHVSTEFGLERSAHNSSIGVAATGGLLAGVVWVVLIIRSALLGGQILRQGLVIGAMPLSLLVSQLVQSVEYLPLTWVTLGFFTVSSSHKERQFE